MSPRGVVWLRRTTQGACLLLFVWLVLAARLHQRDQPIESLQLFFDIDPLILLATWLAAHTVPATALLALITLGVTLVLGRVFCGWLCPLGTVHNMASWLRRKVRKRAPQTDAFSPWQRGKYYLLVALLVAALFGAHWVGVFDPLSLLYRSAAVAVLPGAQYAVEDGATAIYHADPHLGPLHLKSLTEPVYRFSRDRVFLTDRPVFMNSTLILALFFAIVLLNLHRARFWCRYVCPLGALLGLFARRPVMRLTAASGECTNCGRCTVRCPGAAQPEKRGEWLPAECFGCWSCVDACKDKAIAFKLGSPLRKPTAAKLDLTKRAMFGSALSGIGALLLFRVTPNAQGRTFNPDLIRPPGALPEREFLQRCIQCGLCMKVCPTNGLQPTFAEAGLEGLWTPRLVPRIGYCEYECNLCGQVCPTGAIRSLSIDERKKVKMGLAAIDTTRCLPYAYDRNCLVCEEHCPIPTKAIHFIEKQVPLREGGTRVLLQPRVDPDLCVGCGICESVCPFEDRAAIRVTSANETRHPNNQPLLAGFGDTSDTGKDAYPDSHSASDPYGG